MMSSAQYSLVTPGVGRRPSGPEVGVDAYRSPFSPCGQAAHFVWSERAMPLAYMLKDNNLPVVVKISEEANVRSDGDNAMDFRQPLLLYRQHQASRLYARNVSTSGSSRKEVGPYVVIPHNYQGLFRPCDGPDSPITSVSTVARLMPASVLSCARCEGYMCVSPIESDVVYQKMSLEPGVYVIKDLVEDDITIHNAGLKGKKTKLVRCLRCVNEDQKEVLFPLKSSGTFYVAKVEPRSNRHATVEPSARVYSWTELADAAGNDADVCNLTATLVHGKPPPQECSFTGTLAFKHVTKDTTVIGCTTSEENPRLFELSPTNKGPNFVLALNQDCFDTKSPLTRCLKFAKQEFERYVSEMKVRRDYEVDNTELREGVK